MKLFITIMIAFLTLVLHGQTGKVIKGIVTDKWHTPISFCSVSIKGTQISTTTNTCGEFELFVRQEDFTIVFNVGFVPFERRIRHKEIQNKETVIFLIRAHGRITNRECKKKVGKKIQTLIVTTSH